MSDNEKKINDPANSGKKPSAPPIKPKEPNNNPKKEKKPVPIAIIIVAAVLVLGGAIFAAVKLAGNKKPGPVVVTDNNGVAVTTPDGEPVTVQPETEVITYVDSSGKTQTTVVYKEITVNVAVTDTNGNTVTEKNGDVVTTQISYRPDIPVVTDNKKPGPVVVTDNNGAVVTTPNGEPVTVQPETEVVTYVGADGKTQTTVMYKEIDVNVTVTDAAGNAVTEKSGEAATTQIHYRPEMPSTVPSTQKNKTTEKVTDSKGSEIIGSTVVAVTDGTGNTGVDKQGEVITTVVPITSVPAIVEEAKIVFKSTQGGSQQDYFSDIIKLDDGSYITANVTNSTDGDFTKFKELSLVAPYTVLSKYGADGSVIWQQTFGSVDGIAVLTSLAPAGDGGFYAAGYGRYIGGADGYGYYDSVVCRFDKNGKEIWHKTFGTSTVDLFNDICVTSDGGVVAVGSVGNNDYDAEEFKLPELNSAACAVKYSANGKLVWKNVFGGNQDSLNGVVEGTDGSIFAVGTFYSGKLFDCVGNSDAGVVKLSADGKFADVAPVAGTGIESFNGITLASDGGIVIVGRSNSADVDNAKSFFTNDLSARGGFDAYIVKFTPSLNVAFAKPFRGQNDDRLSAVVQNAKGNYIAVGYTNSSSRDLKGVTTRGGDDMVIACFDKSGDLLWARAFGGTKNETADAICLGSDGGYVVAGKTYSNDVDLKGIAPYAGGKSVAAIVKFPE